MKPVPQTPVCKVSRIFSVFHLDLFRNLYPSYTVFPDLIVVDEQLASQGGVHLFKDSYDKFMTDR